MHEARHVHREMLEVENARLRARIAQLEAGDPETMANAEPGPGRNALFSAIQSTRMPMILTDPHQPDNPIIFANQSFINLSGYSAEELVGRNCRFLQGEDTDPDVRAKIREAIRARRKIAVDVVNYRKDGSRFINELYISPVFAPDGALLYFFGSQVDITIVTEARSQLAASESRYRALFDSMVEGFCIIEFIDTAAGPLTDYVHREANPAFNRQAGLPNSIGRSAREMIGAEADEWIATYRRVLDEGKPIHFTRELVTTGHHLEVSAWPNGVLGSNQVAVLFNDITVRRMAETAQEQISALLEQQVTARTDERDRMWNNSPDLLVIVSRDGVYRRVNPAWTDILGYSADELAGCNIIALCHPDDVAATERAFEVAQKGFLSNFENRLRHKDGSYRWVQWVTVHADDEIFATGRHVTEAKEAQQRLRETEDQLRQAQKIEAVGQLTGGIAHDFNNLLTVIRGSVDLLRNPNLSEDRRERYTDAIADTAERAARLTGQLLAFSRRQALVAETFDTADSIRNLREVIASLCGSRIDLVIDAESCPCLVRADRNQFDTAIVNMAVNARDAMNAEGRLTIRMMPTSFMPAIRSHPTVHGNFIAVSLTDTGCGIAADQVDHIFEPFFTTKGVGEGTGLGLSQVFGFAKQSGGEIMVESDEGVGTTFTLYLPSVDADQGTIKEDRAEPRAKRGEGLCILIVEDNKEVGDFARSALAELGYTTVLAGDAATALGELRAGQTRFDAVFSDVVMPGMSGVDLGREIRRAYPDLPVLLTSGYSTVLAQDAEHGFDLLRKPYSVDELSRALGLVLAMRA